MEVNASLAMLGFGTIGTITIGIFKFMFNTIKSDRKRIDERLDLLETSNVALLGDKIFHLCQAYLKRGWVSIDELKNLERIFKSYEANGGNGTAKHLYEKVLKMPNEKEE